jgi:hypothetical protein
MGAGIVTLPRLSVPEPAKPINLSDGMISHWKFNDSAISTAVIDSYLKGTYPLTATSNTSTLSATGKVNDCFDFDQNDYCYSISSMSELDPSVFDFSISLWLKEKVGHPTTHYLFDFTYYGGGLQIALARSGTDLQSIVYGISSSYNKASGAFSSSDWTHVILTWDASEKRLRLYIDNSIQSGTTFTDTIQTPVGINETFVASRADENVAYIWDGFIDEFRTYDRILSESERANIFNEGRGTEVEFTVGSLDGGGLSGSYFNPRVPNGQDYSPQGDDLVFQGGAKCERDGLFNCAGSGYALSQGLLDNLSGKSSITIAGWVKVPTVGSDKYILHAEGMLGLSLESTNARFPKMTIEGANGGDYIIEGANGTWTALVGQMVHVGCVWRGGNDGDLYVNGQVVTKVEITATTPDIFSLIPIATDGTIGCYSLVGIGFSNYLGTKIGGFEYYLNEVKSAEWFAQQYERGLV